MIYCPRCGVALDSRNSHCPLCHFSMEHLSELLSEEKKQQPGAKSSLGEIPQLYPEDEKAPKSQGSSMSTKDKQKLGILIVGLTFVLPIFSTLAIDIAINRSITWSQYVFLPISFLSISAIAFVLKPRTPIIGISVSLVCAFLLSYLTNGMTTGYWAWQLDDTIFAYSALIAEILAVYIIYFRGQWVSLVTSSLVSVTLYLLGLEILLQAGAALRWSPIVGLSIMAPVALLWYASLVKKKGLNLIGAGALIITLYLMGLNLLLQGELSWSWIPFAFLIPVCLCSYLLNTFWFKGTDWKKALHL